MIKKIHYIWLGGKPLTLSARICLSSWRKFMPDWEIMRWDESNFPINDYRWVREAVESRKFAFAADFIRLHVLNQHGGLYMDTDIQLFKPIAALLDSPYVTAIQNNLFNTDWQQFVAENGIDSRTGKTIDGFGTLAALMYSEPDNAFLKQAMTEFYGDGQREFLNHETGGNNSFIIDGEILPLLNRMYGFRFRDEEQRHDGVHLYPSTVFANGPSLQDDSYSMHWCDNSWVEKEHNLPWKIKYYKLRNKYLRIYKMFKLSFA